MCCTGGTAHQLPFVPGTGNNSVETGPGPRVLVKGCKSCDGIEGSAWANYLSEINQCDSLPPAQQDTCRALAWAWYYTQMWNCFEANRCFK
jgi:hypothetical protein